MNVYNISILYDSVQIHCVVAENMSRAEQIFLKKYPDSSIEQITLHSAYVLLQEK